MYPINPNWSFAEAIEWAWKSYIGYGVESKGRRNNYLKAWGNVVGRDRAIESFDEFVDANGSYENAASALNLNVRTFKGLRQYFLQLPRREIRPLDELDIKMVLDSVFPAEEDRQYEFKEVLGRDPASSVRNTSDEYAVAFLNSEGVRILWGIRYNDRVIVGVELSSQQKDEIRRGITNKMDAIRPHVDIASIRIIFHPVYNKNLPVPDLYVVELSVPRGDSQRLYFTGGDEAFVRVDGVKQKLRGPAIQQWIMTHFVVNPE